jgi:hypothetical protein
VQTNEQMPKPRSTPANTARLGDIDFMRRIGAIVGSHHTSFSRRPRDHTSCRARMHKNKIDRGLEYGVLHSFYCITINYVSARGVI